MLKLKIIFITYIGLKQKSVLALRKDGDSAPNVWKSFYSSIVHKRNDARSIQMKGIIPHRYIIHYGHVRAK